jgi:hypothetical protein
MYSIGIPKDSVLKYETSLKANKFLLVVHGTVDEVERASGILPGYGRDRDDGSHGRGAGRDNAVRPNH